MSGSQAWPAAPADLRASREHVDVWRCDVDDAADDASARALLSEQERQRADEFRITAKRREFIVGRWLMRTVLGRLLGYMASEVSLTYEAKGKPGIAASQNTRGIQFNLSHSHGLIVLATTVGRAVGVDVERVNVKDSYERLAERFFSPREVRTLMSIDEALRLRAFHLCWTRKEAYLKATGLGIGVALDSFDTLFWPEECAGIDKVRGQGDAAKWSMMNLPLRDEHVGTVAIEGKEVAMRCWRAPRVPWANESAGGRVCT